MTIKERELQKLYEMFLPKPFVKDSCFITFFPLRVKHYCLTLRGYNCASYEKRCQSRELGKALDSTHLSQHEVHHSWDCQPGVERYGPASLLIGLEIVVSVKTIL